MELMIVVVGLCVLGILATLFGVDSRDTLRSSEHDLASLGWRWDEPAQARRSVSAVRPAAREDTPEVLAEAA
jgi:hypothetical protein